VLRAGRVAAGSVPTASQNTMEISR